ncbi:hypothetical protein D7003_18245 [Arthrobacter oryzae]|uniref:Uncharacterized protein n=1 Tax=Arthrobacter oryzae TaxID=409290 RepID=A0A3N0BNE0_9MICC|nr:hypothetical protein D7003_18245 [Arthrobacter oryzae]
MERADLVGQTGDAGCSVGKVLPALVGRLSGCPGCLLGRLQPGGGPFPRRRCMGPRCGLYGPQQRLSGRSARFPAGGRAAWHRERTQEVDGVESVRGQCPEQQAAPHCVRCSLVGS